MAAQPPKPRIQPWSLWIIAVFLLGSVPITLNYLKRNRAEALDPRPPYLGKLERDLSGQNRDGSTAQLSSLKGQIWIASYLYTASPAKSPSLARLLQPLWEEFGEDPRLHFVTFSVDPAGDTPEKRTDFLRTHGVDHPRWWFLTADPTDLSRYVIRYLRMMPSRPVTNPDLLDDWGPIQHDIRVALIDGKANLRGHYQLLHPETGTIHLARLRHDLRYLLAEPAPSPREP